METLYDFLQVYVYHIVQNWIVYCSMSVTMKIFSKQAMADSSHNLFTMQFASLLQFQFGFFNVRKLNFVQLLSQNTQNFQCNSHLQHMVWSFLEPARWEISCCSQVNITSSCISGPFSINSCLYSCGGYYVKLELKFMFQTPYLFYGLYCFGSVPMQSFLYNHYGSSKL